MWHWVDSFFLLLNETIPATIEEWVGSSRSEEDYFSQQWWEYRCNEESLVVSKQWCLGVQWFLSDEHTLSVIGQFGVWGSEAHSNTRNMHPLVGFGTAHTAKRCPPPNFGSKPPCVATHSCLSNQRRCTRIHLIWHWNGNNQKFHRKGNIFRS